MEFSPFSLEIIWHVENLTLVEGATNFPSNLGCRDWGRGSGGRLAGVIYGTWRGWGCASASRARSVVKVLAIFGIKSVS